MHWFYICSFSTKNYCHSICSYTPLIVLSLKSRTGNRENKEGVSDCITFTDWNRGLCNQNSVGGVYYTPEDKRNDVNQIENRQALYALKKKTPEVIQMNTEELIEERY